VPARRSRRRRGQHDRVDGGQFALPAASMLGNRVAGPRPVEPSRGQGLPRRTGGGGPSALRRPALRLPEPGRVGTPEGRVTWRIHLGHHDGVWSASRSTAPTRSAHDRRTTWPSRRSRSGLGGEPQSPGVLPHLREADVQRVTPRPRAEGPPKLGEPGPLPAARRGSSSRGGRFPHKPGGPVTEAPGVRVYYHVARAESVPRVLRIGLSGGSTWDGRIYLWPSLRWARWWAAQRRRWMRTNPGSRGSGNLPVVLRVRTSLEVIPDVATPGPALVTRRHGMRLRIRDVEVVP
jgi:hypothetical protein